MKLVLLALGFLAIFHSSSALLAVNEISEIIAAINSEYTAPNMKPLLEAMLLEALAEQGIGGVNLPAILPISPIVEPIIAGPAILPIVEPVQPIVEPVEPVAAPISSPLVQLILNIKTNSQPAQDLPSVSLPSMAYGF